MPPDIPNVVDMSVGRIDLGSHGTVAVPTLITGEFINALEPGPMPASLAGLVSPRPIGTGATSSS